MRPTNPLPFIISLPHCSAKVPQEFRPRLALDDKGIGQSKDHGSAEVFGGLPVLEVVRAQVSRLVVDLNRREDDLGSKGVVASYDYCDRPIFLPGRKPDPGLIQDLIQRYHRPFHQSLALAIERNHHLGLFDCHSLDGKGPPGAPDRGSRRADLTLGNNGNPSGLDRPDRPEGSSCPPEKLEIIASAFRGQGFSVSLNQPYPGGFITRKYGPELAAAGKFVVQIEINKDLFWEPGDWLVIPERIQGVKTRVLAAMREMADELAS